MILKIEVNPGRPFLGVTQEETMNTPLRIECFRDRVNSAVG